MRTWNDVLRDRELQKKRLKETYENKIHMPKSDLKSEDDKETKKRSPKRRGRPKKNKE